MRIAKCEDYIVMEILSFQMDLNVHMKNINKQILMGFVIWKRHWKRKGTQN